MTTSVEGGPELQTSKRCARCETVTEDRYCACCGTELNRPRDLSTKQFLKEVIVAITDVDSALIASFKSLVTKPGHLTAEYLWGDRNRFLAPFRLFLLCNVIYFVAAAQLKIGVLTVPFNVQTERMMYGGVASGMVDERLQMKAPAMTLEERAARDSIKKVFATKYDGATVSVGKIIVAVLIPLYALVLQILYIGRRRFFAEHLILATHLTAFLLVAVAGMGLVAALAERAIRAAAWNDEFLFDAFFLIAFGSYTYLAQRVVYETGRTGAAVRTVLLAACMAPILVTLKFVLFVVTLHWVG